MSCVKLSFDLTQFQSRYNQLALRYRTYIGAQIKSLLKGLFPDFRIIVFYLVSVIDFSNTTVRTSTNFGTQIENVYFEG